MIVWFIKWSINETESKKLEGAHANVELTKPKQKLSENQAEGQRRQTVSYHSLVWTSEEPPPAPCPPSRLDELLLVPRLRMPGGHTPAAQPPRENVFPCRWCRWGARFSSGRWNTKGKTKKKTTPQVCVYNPHSVVGCGRRASNLVPLQHIQAKQHIHRLVFQNGERTREEVSLYLDLSWTRTTKTTQFLPIMQYHIYVYTYSSLAQIWGADHQLMITDVTLFFLSLQIFWTRRQRYQPKWTLPIIFWVPTPLAIPAQRRSTNRMMLQRSAHAWLIMVIWAPENRKCQSLWF